jgi:glycosyltransferase involved in cell wall biosynthesis
MVSYKVKPDRVEEHEALIRAVFDELAKAAPAGIRYGAFKQPDGVSFVHVAFISAEKNPLDAIAAFKTFTARIRERCDDPPVAVDLVEVGAFGF